MGALGVLRAGAGGDSLIRDGKDYASAVPFGFPFSVSLGLRFQVQGERT